MDLLAHTGVHLLETLFFLGLLGSAGVVLLSFFEDVSVAVLHSDEDPAGSRSRRRAARPDGSLTAAGTTPGMVSNFTAGMANEGTVSSARAAKTQAAGRPAKARKNMPDKAMPDKGTRDKKDKLA